MPKNNIKQQNVNTSKILMGAFYKIEGKYGATASDVTDYLQHTFGNVWKMGMLTRKAEQTLKRSAALGILEKHGDRYVEKIAPKVKRCHCSRRILRRLPKDFRRRRRNKYSR